MASELADAIVEASVRMHKQEKEFAVDAYLTADDESFLIKRTQNVGNRIIGRRCYNFFDAIREASKLGYKLMQGDAAKELLEQANAAHKACHLEPLYALFQQP